MLLVPGGLRQKVAIFWMSILRWSFLINSHFISCYFLLFLLFYHLYSILRVSFFKIVIYYRSKCGVMYLKDDDKSKSSCKNSPEFFRKLIRCAGPWRLSVVLISKQKEKWDNIEVLFNSEISNVITNCNRSA